MKYKGFRIAPNLDWRCSEEKCPAYDGKRCAPMGFRPAEFCEPRVLLARGLISKQRKSIRNLLRLVQDFADSQPCDLDHHGYCQAHDWFEDGECPDARAKLALEKLAPKYLKGKHV